MNLWLSKCVVLDAINLWLQQQDRKVGINGSVFDGPELRAIHFEEVCGDIRIEVETLQTLKNRCERIENELNVPWVKQ